MKKSCRLLLILSLFASVFSCTKNAANSPATGSSDDISGSATIPSGSLAIIIVNELHDELLAKTDLTVVQAKQVSVKAVGALEIKKLSLLAADGYEERIEDFADEIVAGAVDALDEIQAIHQRQVNHVLEVIIESIVRSLKGRTSALTEEALPSLLLVISESAMKSLDEAGFSIQSMEEAARAIVASAIGTLDDSGILNETNGKTIVAAIVKGAVRGMKESPLAKSSERVKDFAAVLDDVMYGAVGSLDDSGFALADIDESMLEVCHSGISELSGLGFTAQEFETIIQAGIEGALDGLRREAGVKEASQLANAVAYCAQGAIEGLAETDVTVAELDEVVALIVEYSVSHMDNLGIKEAETEAALETLLSRASLGLIIAGFNKDRPEEFGDALGDIAFAADEGLNECGFATTEIQVLMDDVTSSLFSSLKEHGFSEAQAQIAGTSYSTTLSAALTANPLITLNQMDLDAHVQAAIAADFAG